MISIKHKAIALLFSVPFLAGVLSGCRSEALSGPNRYPVTLTIIDGTAETRSGGREDYTFERTVGRVDVFVYNSDGTLDAKVSYNGIASPLILRCTTGSKTVAVYVNGSSSSVFYDNASLNSGSSGSVSDYLSWTDLSSARFTMRGGSSIHVEADGENSFSVAVSRTTGRVDLQSIDWEFPSGHTARFLGCYISNACAVYGGGFTVNSGANWYNKCGRADATTGTLAAGSTRKIDFVNYFPENALTAYTPSSPIAMTTGVTWYAPTVTSSMESSGTRGAQMYAMPNTYGVASFWNPGTYAWNASGCNGGVPKTRLVCVFSIDGTTYYYPYTFTNFNRNYSYALSLSIYSYGADDPEKAVTSDVFATSVTVKDWSGSISHSETL